MKIELVLCLPRDLPTVAFVRSLAGAALEQAGVSPECVDDIRLALSEACNNVVLHATKGEDYEVRLILEDDKCSVVVVDAGGGANLGRVTPAMPETHAGGGRGVALMAALTSELRFESRPEDGTIVRMVKDITLRPDGALARLLPTSDLP